ncbi:MAG: c-type cytochrome [Gammaproteobacteria bacterium]
MKTILILVLGLLPGLAGASELSVLAAKLHAIAQDNTRVSDAVERGRERTALCVYCHGADGISNRKYIPNLAGQSPTYLLKQMLHFSSGERKSDVMQPLAARMTKSDMIDVAIYYSRMANKAAADHDLQTYDAKLASRGKPIYQAKCAHCHGVSGRGSGVFPQLAGQKIDYVLNTLKMFASPTSEAGNALLFNAARSNPQMVSVLKQLDAQQIRAVANYIAILH